MVVEISKADVDLISNNERNPILRYLRLYAGERHGEVLLKTGAKIKVQRDHSDRRKFRYYLVGYACDGHDLHRYLELIGQEDLLPN